jgi:hypothetical protein
MSATVPVGTPASASAASIPSKAAMLFMRASSKAQQDKGKDLSVSIESLKAELAGAGCRVLGVHVVAADAF